MNHVIHVRGEELDIAIVPVAPVATDSAFKRYAINISHPCGGEASFEVLDYRGFQIGQCTSDDCPSAVADAVGQIVRKMDKLWSRAVVGSDTRAETLFDRAVILYRNRTEAA